MPAMRPTSWSPLFIMATCLGYAPVSQAKPVGFTSGAWTGSVSCGGTTTPVSGTTLAACEAALAAKEEDCLMLNEIPTSQDCTETGYHWTSADGLDHTSPLISVGGGTTRPGGGLGAADFTAHPASAQLSVITGPTRGSSVGHPGGLGPRTSIPLKRAFALEDDACPSLDLEEACDDDVLDAVEQCADVQSVYACLPPDLEVSDACFEALDALDQDDRDDGGP